MAENDPTQKDKTLNTNPTKPIIAGLVIILLFFGGIGTWSAFFPFAGAVIAPGTVQVSQNKKTVQHLEGGIVDRILVREGDLVERGQPLIKLKGSKIISTVNLLQGRLRTRLAETSRLKAEAAGKSEITWSDELLNNKNKTEIRALMALEKNIFTSRRKSLTGKIEMHRSRIDQLHEKINGLKEELKAQKEIIATLREEIAAKEELLQGKYIDKAHILEMKRKLAERKGRQGSLKQSIAETKQKIEEIKLNIENLRDTYREEAVTRLAELSDEIVDLREQLIPQLDARQRLVIKAPMTGEVMNLRIHSENSGVIKAGEPILDIVPAEADLIIEARIRPDQITDVKRGQDTKVTLSAFDRNTTPPVPGEVIYVSADQVTRETPTGEQSFYLAHVRVDKDELSRIGAYISPGMPTVCYITTEKRTIIEYLLDPLFGFLDKSLRET